MAFIWSQILASYDEIKKEKNSIEVRLSVMGLALVFIYNQFLSLPNRMTPQQK